MSFEGDLHIKNFYGHKIFKTWNTYTMQASDRDKFLLLQLFADSFTVYKIRLENVGKLRFLAG